MVVSGRTAGVKYVTIMLMMKSVNGFVIGRANANPCYNGENSVKTLVCVYLVINNYTH